MTPKSSDINNLSARLLQAFKASQSGLLSPDGNLIPVRVYGHFDELKKYPEFEYMISDFEDRVADAQTDFEDAMDDSGGGGHPFEIYIDEQKHQLRIDILDKAYQLGWGRISFMQKRPKPHLVELETHPNAVNTLQPYAKSVAELCDAELHVHRVEKNFSER